MNIQLKMVRANDFSFNIQVLQNGLPLNITGGTLRMTAKWLPTDSDANAVFKIFSPSTGITITSATQGLATLLVASTLTDINAIPFHTVMLYYDIQYTSSVPVRDTIMYGQLTIIPNISETSP